MARPQDQPLPPQDLDAYTTRRPVQRAALAVSVVLVLLGALGFVPWVTTGLGELRFAGPDSGALLFGVFAVSVLHNLVHLGTGVLGFVLAGSRNGARALLLGGGLVYLMLGVLGLVAPAAVPANAADIVLNFALAAVLLASRMRFTAHRA